MKRLILFTCIGLMTVGQSMEIHSQTSYGAYFTEICTNNKSLTAARGGNEATKQMNMTGLNLENPQVDFAYQWGPLDKIILDVSQSFDFATLSGGKRNVARQANKVADLEYAVSVRDLLGQADKTLTTLAYYNSVLSLYEERMKRMTTICELTEKMADLGAMNSLDHSMVCLEMEQLHMETEMQKSEYETLCNELTALNGGKRIDTANVRYDTFELPSDFEAWYDAVASNDLTLKLAEARMALSERNLSLSKSQGLPEFSVGYTSEMVKDDNHYGVSLGIALPLWGNHNAVKAAKAEVYASQAAYDDAGFQLYSDLKNKFQKASTLGESVKRYRAILEKANAAELLEKSYQEQHLSATDYLRSMNELAAYEFTLLELERDYQLALCDLKAVILY